MDLPCAWHAVNANAVACSDFEGRVDKVERVQKASRRITVLSPTDFLECHPIRSAMWSSCAYNPVLQRCEMFTE
eukprot:294320-Amphidinium_carterae.1